MSLRLRFLRNFVLLFILWFALSGMASPLLLGFGVASSLLTAWLLTRLVYTRDDPIVAFRPLKLVIYLMWLVGQIVVSSIRVMYLALHPRMPISPGFHRIDARQATRLGRVTFANSITLTPGTASVDLDDTHILVHSIEADGARGLAQGDMGRRVAACEVADSGVPRPDAEEAED